MWGKDNLEILLNPWQSVKHQKHMGVFGNGGEGIEDVNPPPIWEEA